MLVPDLAVVVVVIVPCSISSRRCFLESADHTSTQTESHRSLEAKEPGTSWSRMQHILTWLQVLFRFACLLRMSVCDIECRHARTKRAAGFGQAWAHLNSMYVLQEAKKIMSEALEISVGFFRFVSTACVIVVCVHVPLVEQLNAHRLMRKMYLHESVH